MEAPVKKFTINLPITLDDFQAVRLIAPTQEVTQDNVVHWVVGALRYTQATLLDAKRRGTIEPEVNQRKRIMQPYRVPGSEADMMLKWEPREEILWTGAVQNYLRWLAVQEQFGEIAGIVQHFGNVGENATFGLFRLLGEHGEKTLLQNRCAPESQLSAIAAKYANDLKQPSRLGELRLQIANVVPPTLPMNWRLGEHRIILRRLDQRDLNRDKQFRALEIGQFMPDALMYVRGVGHADDLRNIGEFIVMAMRLFANADPDVMRDEYFTDNVSALLRKSIQWHERRPRQTHPLILTKENGKCFVQFAKALYRAIGVELLYRPQWRFGGVGGTERSEPSHWLQIATSRYEDALRSDDVLERKVASAVMSIESLVLTPNEKSELLYRVSLRCAVIGELLGLDSQEIRRIAGRAYDIRSRFVHGGLLASKDMKKLDRDFGGHDAFADHVIALNRMLLLVGAFAGLGKGEIVERIDDAMVFPAARRELAALLRRIRPYLNGIDALNRKEEAA